MISHTIPDSLRGGFGLPAVADSSRALLSGRKQGHTTLCMQAEGYNLDRWQSNCPRDFQMCDGPTIAGCYMPYSTVSAWLTKLQIAAGL
jgi:hypothetical protein